MSKLVIKKYSNRKLYDTSLKRYTTLKEVMLLPTESFVVIDNRTKNDVTRKVLAYGRYVEDCK